MRRPHGSVTVWSDVSIPVFGKFVRQRAVQRQLKIPSPVLTQRYVFNSNFENIAWLRPLHMDRASQKVRAGAASNVRQDFLMVLQNNETFVFRQIFRLTRERLDPDRVAGFDREHRWNTRIPFAPMYGLWACGKVMTLHGWSTCLSGVSASLHRDRLRFVQGPYNLITHCQLYSTSLDGGFPKSKAA